MATPDTAPGTQATEVVGSDGVVRVNIKVEDSELGGETDAVETNQGYVNGQQGE